MFKKVVDLAIVLIFLLVVVGVVRPYWHKYWIGQEIEAAAIYGTKNSIEDTRNFLSKKMSESGRDFRGDDFRIAKNEDNTVTISLTYYDRIRVFGLVLKELKFTVEKTKSEVEATF
jgi:hypothetical protein